MLISDDSMKTIFNLKICDWMRWKKQEILFWALHEELYSKVLENIETSQISMRITMKKYRVN